MVISTVEPKEAAPSAVRPTVAWSGHIPPRLAEYLDRQEKWEIREVQGVVARFGPVRQLAGVARLLHEVLEYGPKQAAEGRLTFAEVIEDRQDFENAISTLRRLVNQAAVKCRILAPRAEWKGKPRKRGKRPTSA